MKPSTAAFALLLSALAVPGCRRGFFEASGPIASDGGALGEWRRIPEGCTRAPFDGLPTGRSASVLTLLWRNGGDPLWRARQPDADTVDEPMRLELARAPEGLMGSLTTVRSQGSARLDHTVCRTLRLDTHEAGASFPEGRPTLAGVLTLDCTLEGSHITAFTRFKACTY